MKCCLALQKISVIVERELLWELVSEAVEAEIFAIAYFLYKLQRRNRDV